jgi:putative Holliday junction resolvase
MARIGRRIAFDYGDVRIGVAVCDPDGILATPLTTLSAKDPALLSNIHEIIEEYEPLKIYLGLPVHLSGKESSSTEKARAFGQMLTSSFDIPLEYIDERLSTISAAKGLASAGIDSKSAKSLIDAAAAVQILEQGLANERK